MGKAEGEEEEDGAGAVMHGSSGGWGQKEEVEAMPVMWLQRLEVL